MWVRQHGVRRRACVPMFPGYLFVRHGMDAAGYAEVSKARGLIRVLGNGRQSLSAVPDAQVEPIRRLHASRIEVTPHRYLKEGQRVRITSGVLAGMEGILLVNRHKKGLLILSVDMLQRSVAVEVDSTIVAAA
jgi:transcription antitermination factor NusG